MNNKRMDDKRLDDLRRDTENLAKIPRKDTEAGAYKGRWFLLSP
jgi:hypothetical protein